MSTSLERLQQALRELKLRKGEPTYGQLADATYLSTSTIGEVLTGRKPASWKSTSAVIKALDGDPEQFQTLWDQAKHGDGHNNGTQPVEPAAAPQPQVGSQATTLQPRHWLKRRRTQVLVAFGGVAILGLSIWLVLPQPSESTADGCWRKYKVVKDGTVRSQDNQVIIGDVHRGDEVRVDHLPQGAKNRRYEVIVLGTQMKGWVVTANLDFEATVCDSP